VTPRLVSRLNAYAFAAVIVLVAAVLRRAADPWLGHTVPYLLFFPAVMLVAAHGGFWPGVFATVLSALIAVLLYLAPIGTFTVSAPGDVLSLSVFVVTGILISRLNETVRRAASTQQRLAAIVESSDDAIVAKDLNGTITSWNRGAERIFGYTPAEAIGQSITLIIPLDRLGEEDRVLASIRAAERVAPFETVRRRKDGTLLDVSITVSPIKDVDGIVIGASKIARDITERRRGERLREELMARERVARDEAIAVRDRLSFLADVGALLTSSLDYTETLHRAVHVALPRLGDYCNVLLEDEQGRMRHVAWGHVNRDKERILRELALLVVEGSSPAVSMTFAQTVMTTGRASVIPPDVMAKAADDASRADPKVVELAVQIRPYASVGVPLFVRGRVVGVMLFGTTEQESRREYSDADVVLAEEFARRVSLAVENARLFRQADELNRLKDEFLATVSHELRTPLSAVLGWSRMLASGQLRPEKTAQAIEAIERNAQAQAKLVDDILDLARGISGNVRLEMTPLNLADVAHLGAEAIAPAAAVKKIDFQVRADRPVTVVGDQARLRQVVWNLLSNAVKFTPPCGRVTLDLASTNGYAELQVTDTGMGIAPAFLPYVFDKFRQADGSFTRQHGGLGLGLAIARHLIELHGGSIEARSQGEGGGATFLVRLPLATVAPETPTLNSDTKLRH
jgi:PAS domain S-box-containing protein